MPNSRELPRDVGVFIRDLRRNARISLRQLAEQAGVSNPYLSQIERGLRRPSAEVLAQLASALRISTPLMYLRAGLLDSRDGHEVLPAIAADPDLTIAQKQSLTQIYETFRRENARAAADANGNGAFVPVDEPVPTAGPASADKPELVDKPKLAGKPAAAARPNAPAAAPPKAPAPADAGDVPQVSASKNPMPRKRTARKATTARRTPAAQSPHEEK